MRRTHVYLSPFGDSIKDRCEIKLADENRRLFGLVFEFIFNVSVSFVFVSSCWAIDFDRFFRMLRFFLLHYIFFLVHFFLFFSLILYIFNSIFFLLVVSFSLSYLCRKLVLFGRFDNFIFTSYKLITMKETFRLLITIDRLKFSNT